MSTYYSYYAAYKKDGKIYPLGPFDYKGTIHPLLSRSRSFASNLHEEFYPIKETEISDELKKYFSSENYMGVKTFDNLKILPLNELPSSNYIKSGYVPINQVEEYEKTKEFDGFYDVITPTVYAAKLEHQLKFGRHEEKINEYGDTYKELNAEDYMFYTWEDTNCKEYESFIIKLVIYTISGYIQDSDLYIIFNLE